MPISRASNRDADDASHRRWLKHDAARWVRPDAARFLAPGPDVLAAYPRSVVAMIHAFAISIAELEFFVALSDISEDVNRLLYDKR